MCHVWPKSILIISHRNRARHDRIAVKHRRLKSLSLLHQMSWQESLWSQHTSLWHYLFSIQTHPWEHLLVTPSRHVNDASYDVMSTPSMLLGFCCHTDQLEHWSQYKKSLATCIMSVKDLLQLRMVIMGELNIGWDSYLIGYTETTCLVCLSIPTLLPQQSISETSII